MQRGANFLMEPWGRSCFAMTWASFLNVVIIGRGCPQAATLPLPRSALWLAFQLIFFRTRTPRLWFIGLMMSYIHSLICVVKTTISPSFDYLVLLVVVAQFYFNMSMIKSHRNCKLRALSNQDKFLCLSMKVTCDFLSLKILYTFLFFYFCEIFVTVLAILAINNFKDNPVGCRVESLFQISVYASILQT